MAPCPSDSRIELHVRGELPSAEASAIDQHAEKCLTCAEKLAGAPVLEEVLTDVRLASQEDTHVATELEGAPPFKAGAEPLVGRVIGDFEVRRLIGTGGMGAVFEAQQISLKRLCALKVLHDPVGRRTAGVLRFSREARAAARLHHTNIVSVFAQGQSDGLHYYAMERIQGTGLDEIIRETRRRRAAHEASRGRAGAPPARSAAGRPRRAADEWSEFDVRRQMVELDRTGPGKRFDVVARLIADVADALDYAHRQGVIHRDVKPSNLILSADGRVTLTDFGLARLLDQPGMTIAGEFLGSPLYMSPEQVAAGRMALDHRTDIYSLGATLFELLTLQAPYLGETREQIIEQIRAGHLRRPRKIDRRISRDLETICLKAMRPDPVHRYGTAGEMADDLRRFIRRFAVHARRVSLMTRATKFIRRRSLEVALITAILSVVLGAGIILLHARMDYNLNRLELQVSQDTANELWRLWDRIRLERLLDQGYLAVGDCRFAQGRRFFSDAIRLVEHDTMHHLAESPEGYLARGLTGYLGELIGIEPGRSGFAADLRAALALHPTSELLAVLCDLPEPQALRRMPADELRSYVVKMAEIGDGPIREMTRGRSGLVYTVMAWTALVAREPDQALAFSDRALTAPPRLAVGFFIRSMILLAKGEPTEAIGMAQLAMLLATPRRSMAPTSTALGYFVRSAVLFVLGRQAEAARQSNTAMELLDGRRHGRFSRRKRSASQSATAPASLRR